jgi:hypothetical protein
MRKHLVSIAIGLLVFTVAWAATGGPASAFAGGPFEIAVGAVRLDGQQENPDADPDGRGTFVYAAFDSRLCYVLTAKKIEPATAAHIHVGAPEVNGPIVIGLIAPTGGFSADCIEAVPDGSVENSTEVLLQSELDAIIASESDFYVNVHNDPFQGGAIRAQLG